MNFTYCPSCGQQNTVQNSDDTNYECRQCGWHFWNNAKGSVAVAFIKDNEVLVSKRGIEPNMGKYDLPGGFVDFNETAQQAAIREISEELGITVSENQLQLISVYNNLYVNGISTIDVVFAVTDWEGQFTASSDAAELAWKPFDFIDDAAFSPPYTGLSGELKARFS